MKTILLSISATLLLSSINANEMSASSWTFPSAEMLQVSQNRQVLFCQANPSKCPAGLSRSSSASSGDGSSSLAGSDSTSSANNISVVLAGDNSSVTLTTSQDAQDNDISSDANTDAEIDYDQVLNYNDK